MQRFPIIIWGDRTIYLVQGRTIFDNDSTSEVKQIVCTKHKYLFESVERLWMLISVHTMPRDGKKDSENISATSKTTMICTFFYCTVARVTVFNFQEINCFSIDYKQRIKEAKLTNWWYSFTVVRVQLPSAILRVFVTSCCMNNGRII